MDLRRLKSLPQLSSFHALSSDTMLEFKGKSRTKISLNLFTTVDKDQQNISEVVQTQK